MMLYTLLLVIVLAIGSIGKVSAKWPDCVCGVIQNSNGTDPAVCVYNLLTNYSDGLPCLQSIYESLIQIESLDCIELNNATQMNDAGSGCGWFSQLIHPFTAIVKCVCGLIVILFNDSRRCAIFPCVLDIVLPVGYYIICLIASNIQKLRCLECHVCTLKLLIDQIINFLNCICRPVIPECLTVPNIDLYIDSIINTLNNINSKCNGTLTGKISELQDARICQLKG